MFERFYLAPIFDRPLCMRGSSITAKYLVTAVCLQNCTDWQSVQVSEQEYRATENKPGWWFYNYLQGCAPKNGCRRLTHICLERCIFVCTKRGYCPLFALDFTFHFCDRCSLLFYLINLAYNIFLNYIACKC